MPKERNKADSYREKAYERGTGVKVSLELAFEWYMKAAELGAAILHYGAGEKVRGWLNGIDISWVISHG